MKPGILIFFCGKMGAGKSTLSKKIAAERNAVLIAEDDWLESLYPHQITSFEDYLRLSSRMKALIKSHVVNILKIGAHVVMDFPANTFKQREWFKEIFSETGNAHELIYIDASNDLCLNQIAKRRIEQPARAAFDTESVFHHVTKYFEEPQPSEGFNIVLIGRSAQQPQEVL